MKTIQLNTIKYFRIFKNEGFIKLHCHMEVFFFKKIFKILENIFLRRIAGLLSIVQKSGIPNVTHNFGKWACFRP